VSYQPAAPGPQGATFSYAPKRVTGLLVGAALVGLGTAVMLVLLALGRGVEPQPVPLRVVFGVAGAVLAVGALWLLVTARRPRQLGVDVGPAGIDVGVGRETIHLPWSQIAAVRFRVYLDRAVTPLDLVDRQSYPRLEIAFRDPDAAERALPALRRLRSTGTTAEGYTHGIDVGTGPFLPRAGIERHLPELQQALATAAGPLYRGASVEKRWFGSRRR